ncbi:hypothetical protein AAG570_008776 [Ranatra chinensis]|uniref:Uncharacterized protein n=1 Tax=Ranatra chinensis TaxID=642074 RepID=A0ABD0YRW1_9HEMI
MAGVMTAVTKWETVGNCVSKSIDGICGAFKGVWSEQELKSMVSALKFELERERQYFQNELLKKEEEIKGANEKVVQAIHKRMLDVKDMYEEKEKCIKKLIESFEEKLEAKDNQIVDTNKRLYTCQAESLEKILENMAKHERNARAERIECEKQGKIEKNEERCDKMLYDKDELLRQMQNRFIDEVKGAQKNLAETSWRVVEKIEKHTTRANDRLAEKDRLISSVQDKIYESFKESNKREIQMRKEMQKREDDHVEKLYEKHHADRKQDRLCYDDYHSLFEKLLYGSLKQLKDMSHENQKHHQQLIDVMQRHQMSTEKLLRDQIEEANRRDKLERDFSFNKE